jgi:hypothetical protein
MVAIRGSDACRGRVIVPQSAVGTVVVAALPRPIIAARAVTGRFRGETVDLSE